MKSEKPTKTEKEVLKHYAKQRLTIKEIALKTKRTPNAIHCALRKLRRKGLLTVANNTVQNKGGQGGSTVQKIGGFRVEAQQLKVRIINSSSKYSRLLKEGNIIFDFEGNEVRLHARQIEIYSRRHFKGLSVQEAYSDSLTYWNAFSRKLENRLGVLLVKAGVSNWKFVKAGEVASEDSPLAKKALSDSTKIRFFAKDDGKLWFSCDWSHLLEHETHHPDRSKLDAERLERHLWDISSNDPLTNSELANGLRELLAAQRFGADNLKETSAAVLNVARLMGLERSAPLYKDDSEESKRALRSYTG